MTAAILLLVLHCNPSWAAEKIPARVPPLPLLAAPLLLNSVFRHKRLADLGSKPQSLEGIYFLCLLALNHSPCSQQANISFVHSSTDDGAVSALLALATLTNFRFSWSLAFLPLSLYIYRFLCHLSSLPSLVHLLSIRAQPALSAPPSHTWDTDIWLGCSKNPRFFVKQFSKVSNIANYFSLEEYIPPFSCHTNIIHCQTSLRTKTQKLKFSPWWNFSILMNTFESY